VGGIDILDQAAVTGGTDRRLVCLRAHLRGDRPDIAGD